MPAQNSREVGDYYREVPFEHSVLVRSKLALKQAAIGLAAGDEQRRERFGGEGGGAGHLDGVREVRGLHRCRDDHPGPGRKAGGPFSRSRLRSWGGAYAACNCRSTPNWWNEWGASRCWWIRRNGRNKWCSIRRRKMVN